MKKLVVAIGDTHFPYNNPVTIRGILDFIKQTKPDVVVQMGDLYDMYSASKYPRSYNITTPEHEMSWGRLDAEKMWAGVRKAAPKAKCFQLMGNHDDRPLKRTLESTPELEHVVARYVSDLLAFPGVETVGGREPLVIDGVNYEHGALKAGQHAIANNMPTVVGHSHVGGVIFNGRLWELNAGWCGDIYAKCFSYVRTRLVASRTTQGFGVVDAMGPRFIAL